METLYISITATQRGFGTDKWKYVVGLTVDERDLGKNGKPIYFQSTALSGGNHGTYWRKAIWSNSWGRFIPRVPDLEIINALGKIN